MALPDVLVIGAPKSGSTALHGALATHPALYMTSPKEPKYFLCGDEPPPAQHGPGDAHSRQEWIWQRDRYERLFDRAPDGALLGESTPFYLWSRDAHRHIAATVPDARLIAVVRDPVDRAYSNWTHAWNHGYEPVGDFLEAVELEPERVAAGWAPFWRYGELSRYGEQLQHLFEHVPQDQVLVLRYRDLVDDPDGSLRAVASHLDIDPTGFGTMRGENVSAWAADTLPNSVLRQAIRTGACLGQHVPPQHWRRVEAPLRAVLNRGNGQRPRLRRDDRGLLLRRYEEDVELLADLTGLDVRHWLDQDGNGAYSVRRS